MAKKAARNRRRKGEPLNAKLKSEIIGIVIVGLACLGLIMIYSASSGFITSEVRHVFRTLMGSGSAVFFLFMGAAGIILMGQNKSISRSRLLGLVILWLVIEGFLQLGFLSEGYDGGLIGKLLVSILVKSVGETASYVILSIIGIISIVLIMNRSIVDSGKDIFNAIGRLSVFISGQIKEFFSVVSDNGKIKNGEKNLKHEKKKVLQKSETKVSKTTQEYPRVIMTEEFPVIEEHVFAEPEPEPVTKIASNPQVAQGKEETEPPKNISDENYQLPSLALISKAVKVKNQRINKDLADNVHVLEETLASFGVKVKVTRVTQGPSITRYEVQPAPGVKVSKITSLADDIALSLAASDVRIEAPIPGKSVIGIEVPNREISIVHLKEVLETEEFQSSPGKLSLALGKDISGSPVIADLTKMPHLLIAGATGSGKSVCINTIIASIVYKSKPDEVKLLLIDPKMVELTNYNGIPHLIAPVVTDPAKAAGALKWIVTEMECRYELFASAGVRDIARYNYIVSKENDKKALPFVVVIIDELSDLMMVAPGDVEDAICRLAQMARAAGIHLIVATQRPSVDVITGLIKANIPSRIAFAVSSQIDSRTILDMAGAEKLLGRGDMLYNPIGMSKPLRVQGCFLADREVKSIVDFLKTQALPEYMEIPVRSIETRNKPEHPEDELFLQAAKVFLENGQASVSLLQRKLRIGYTRAARLMDILEEKGVVGSYEGSKPREVLLSWSQFEQKFKALEENK